MLIGSLQASAEQQSLTIRRNNGFTMKEATLLTRGRISMHCRSLEVSCVDPERDLWLEMPTVPLRELPLSLSWFDHQRKRSEGTGRDLVEWAVGDPITDLGHGIYCRLVGRGLCRLDARGQWIVKWVSLEPFTSRHVPKCFAGTGPSLQVQPCRCWLQPRRDRGSVCVKASVPSLSVYCSLWGAPGPFSPARNEAQHI